MTRLCLDGEIELVNPSGQLIAVLSSFDKGNGVGLHVDPDWVETKAEAESITVRLRD